MSLYDNFNRYFLVQKPEKAQKYRYTLLQRLSKRRLSNIKNKTQKLIFFLLLFGTVYIQSSFRKSIHKDVIVSDRSKN